MNSLSVIMFAKSVQADAPHVVHRILKGATGLKMAHVDHMEDGTNHFFEHPTPPRAAQNLANYLRGFGHRAEATRYKDESDGKNHHAVIVRPFDGGQTRYIHIDAPGKWSVHGGFTKAIKASHQGKVERYQWMKNKEGGQTFGNHSEIRPLSDADFEAHVKPRMREGFAANAAEYSQKTGATHISVFRQHDGKKHGAWRFERIGTPETLRPQNKAAVWAKKVSHFNSPEALAHGAVADSEMTKAVASGSLAQSLSAINLFGDRR